MQSDIILQVNNLTKNFGSVTALDNVSFTLKRGEIHALMGENGAGKSTFIKILTGVLQPNEGEIIYEGEKVSFSDSIEAGKNGIVAIYQHPSTFPSLSVTENIFMTNEITKKTKFFDYKTMRSRAKELMQSLNSSINVNASMSSLSAGEQQLVEIAKALSRNAKVLILDEPTASLSKIECDKLYQILDKLKADGLSMIFITHRFEDMYRLADSVTVFRDASYISSYPIKGLDEKTLIKDMVGRELTTLYPSRDITLGEEIIKIDGLTRQGYFSNISFSVKAGEVVSLTGLVGAGRTEVCESIYGIHPYDEGNIYLKNQLVKIKNPRQALKHGIGLLSEDRLRYGLFLDKPIYQNTTSLYLQKYSHLGFLFESNEIKDAHNLGKKVLLKAKNVKVEPTSLSGGNQQKVVFTKLMNRPLKVIILDEPTKGIDVLAKYSVYEMMNEMASKGAAIIMVSSEMSEVLGMSDRIFVMRNGKISKTFDKNEATQEKILEAAIG